MTKLPEPLPYDYVDELINDNYFFKSDVGFYCGARMKIHRAWPRIGIRNNTPNTLAGWKYDYYGTEKDDEYINWSGMGGYEYTAEEFTEEELDHYVKYGNVHAIKKLRDERNGRVPQDSNPLQARHGEQGQDDSRCLDDP